MKLRRPLAASTAAALACTGLVLAGAAGAAPRTVNDAPISTLTGVSGGPEFTTTGMTVGDDSFVYVAGYDADDQNDRIEVYAPGADGDDAPVRTITGAQTDLDEPYRIAVADDGRIYVGDRTDQEIVVFADDANGDVAPLQVIDLFDEGSLRPHALAIGPDGNLYVGSDSLPEISVLPLDAESRADDELYSFGTDTGDVTHIDAIAFNAEGSEVFVTEDRDYNEDAEPRIVVLPNPGESDEVDPLRTIEGPQTGLGYPGSVQVDSTGNAYVVEYENNEVRVFAPGADGDVEPHTVLAGEATGLQSPWNLFVRPGRKLVVAGWANGEVSTFAPIGPYRAATAPTQLAVAAPGGDGTRLVTWGSVADADTGDLTYDVVVKRGSTVVHTVKTASTSTRIPRAALRAGSNTVTVTAANARGTSAGSTVGFTVAAAKPGNVRSLKVKRKAGAAKRPVIWKAPAWDGGATAAKYRVTVKQGSIVYYKKALKAGKRKRVLDTRRFGLGKLTVTVQERNSAGWGPAATKKFTVKP
jgi:hypothetical protein